MMSIGSFVCEGWGISRYKPNREVESGKALEGMGCVLNHR